MWLSGRALSRMCEVQSSIPSPKRVEGGEQKGKGNMGKKERENYKKYSDLKKSHMVQHE